jgi:hypothetical protein
MVSLIFKPDPLNILQWGLHSANDYNPEQLEEFSTNSNCTKQTVFAAKCAGMRLNIVCWATNRTLCRTCICVHTKGTFLNCSLESSPFNFCVAMAFFPINLCNCSHHL